ncbi:MAG: adenylate/guanylate cyclase domain-containing protein, partial [Stellaceae bacterium]
MKPEPPTTICDTSSVAEWLTDGARSAFAPHQVLGQGCERLVACGLPLWRVAVFVRTLHQHVMGRRYLWRPDAEVVRTAAPIELLETAEFRESPVVHVQETGRALRRKLADRDCAIDFPLLAELREEGVTDYLASPLFFTDGAIHSASWSTRRPGGFTDAQIAGIEAVAAPLARVTESLVLRGIATTLLDTYVGHQAGERILAGHIRRGDVEEIDAAIWLSDMRGFTPLADRLPPRVLIGLLNRYFDCQVPAILAQGGEVLKFIGDGLLAIFPLAENGAALACAAALAAAREAQTNILALAGDTGIDDVGGVGFGLALHIGRVLYGNIGGGNRLDFTCIGPAVNLAARIEALAGRLGRAILASAD